jgi:hypothetical protein
MKISGHGVEADLPAGWEGSIRTEREDQLGAAAVAGARAFPVTHLATFALPADRGDFGSGAVDAMRPDDDFVALLEYGEEEAHSPLFSPQGLPRRLDPRRFSARSLQRGLPGQAGWQLFFTTGGRAFCLYVVLGDRDDAHRHCRRVEGALAGLRIEERP